MGEWRALEERVEQMSNSSLKMIGFVFLLAFGIFLGVDLSTRGIERINGPMLAVNQVEAAQTVSKTLPLITASEAKQEPLEVKSVLPKPQIQETAMNHAADKFGELLQIMADHLIRWVVSFFDGLFS